MKLLSLINAIKNNKLEEVLSNMHIKDKDMINVYMEGVIDINSKIRFFNVDDIDNEMFMDIDGKKYVNLFPLMEIISIVDGMIKSNSFLSDDKLSEMFIKYRKDETPNGI